ncbi:MAG: oxidoreductase [Myxococcaceae bacterium]|nr:oxidoreductase [Myxococcaceae bacterium]MBH2006192.1 oxidoreductase [Myxococcaceae bacterium]
MTIGKKIRLIESRVIEATQETQDTWTLHFQTEDRNYLPGQFLSIDPKQFPELSELVAYLEAKKGKREVVRAYSMASAPHESTVSITIKPERFSPEHDDYPPLLSPFLASAAIKGRLVRFLGYTGPYTLPLDLPEHTDEVLHLAAGSGIVPNFSLLKDQLIQNRHPEVRHTLVYVNKTEEDTIFRTQIELLAHQYPDRFRYVPVLTREQKAGVFYGRPTLDLIRSLMNDPNRVLVYACGSEVSKWHRKKAEISGISPTPRFIESISHMMKEIGIDRKRFKFESYG